MARSPINEMLRIIESECRFTKGLTGRKVLQPEVKEAMGQVPRDTFVPDVLKSFAYDNNPLPIGNGQTISQPFIVALMTDLLNPGKDDVILEVGTGSGYQAAILSLLVNKVYTIEILATLAEQAAERLARLGYENVEVRHGDGYRGWPEHAPFDGIIVTATADHVPPSLKEQLRPGGRLIIPVGYSHMSQQLLLLEKDETGKFTTRNILSVSFVPLTGEARLV
ncbi:MAG: protein-L-isoaspartate(D-aspartate) O-methyltransferase [Desulfobulbaceae bacterium]|nr:protein-L-isoaspartate(D-aspartate) O-methyltransferase [Desulfobulbaceae bacterium]